MPQCMLTLYVVFGREIAVLALALALVRQVPASVCTKSEVQSLATGILHLAPYPETGESTTGCQNCQGRDPRADQIPNLAASGYPFPFGRHPIVNLSSFDQASTATAFAWQTTRFSVPRTRQINKQSTPNRHRTSQGLVNLQRIAEPCRGLVYDPLPIDDGQVKNSNGSVMADTFSGSLFSGTRLHFWHPERAGRAEYTTLPILYSSMLPAGRGGDFVTSSGKRTRDDRRTWADTGK